MYYDRNIPSKALRRCKVACKCEDGRFKLGMSGRKCPYGSIESMLAHRDTEKKSNQSMCLSRIEFSVVACGSLAYTDTLVVSRPKKHLSYAADESEEEEY